MGDVSREGVAVCDVEVDVGATAFFVGIPDADDGDRCADAVD
jgi:hypothetical protein